MRAWQLGMLVLGLASCRSESSPPRPGFVFPHEGRVVDLGVTQAESEAGTWLYAAEAPPSGRCVAPLVVVDHTEAVLHDPSAVLDADALRVWERRHGPVPFGAVLAVRSGWSARQRAPEPEGGAEPAPHPGVDRAVLERLVRERELAAVLVEAPSLGGARPGEALGPDRAQDWMLEQGRFVVVGCDPLDGLPATGCLCIVAPFPAEGPRRPVRVYAIAPRVPRASSPW